MALQSHYKASFTSFSGADITATFNGIVIGQLQSITYSVTREKVPVYSMGSPDPRSFSRGKRGIAGSLVFTVFNRDSLYDLKKQEFSKLTINSANAQFREGLESYMKEVLDRRAGNMPGGTASDAGEYFGTIDDWNEIATNDDAIYEVEAFYADEIPPFDVTITMQNEYGNAAKFSLVGVEIMNEGSGMSMDDITTEKACTFVAKSLTPLEPIVLTKKDIKDKAVRG